MTQCPALVYENTEVVIVQTDAKTFADMFPYPICNLCAVSLLYFTICQRLTKFMTSTSLSANKLKLSALRWAFFVQGRREPRSCKALHGKSPKGRRPLSFNLFNAAPPRRRRGMWRTQCGKSRNGGHHKRGLRENIITRDLDRAASPRTSETLTHRPAAFCPHIKFPFL